MYILASVTCDISDISDVFYHGTVGFFEKSATPDREPDYVSDSGSAYWYEPEGVYRLSDHWGRGVGSCDWHIGGYMGDSWLFDDGEMCGFSDWTWLRLKQRGIPMYDADLEGCDSYKGDLDANLHLLALGSIVFDGETYAFDWSDDRGLWEASKVAEADPRILR